MRHPVVGPSPAATMRRLVIVAALLAGACATTPADRARAAQEQARVAAKLQQRLAGYHAEKPTDCLLNTETRNANTESFGSVILYRPSPGGVVYRNDTTGGCEALARDSYLVTVSPEGRLCRGDIARTVDRSSHVETGSCALGSFTPYRR